MICEENQMRKILKFFDADPDPASCPPWIQDPGSGMKKIGSGMKKSDPGFSLLDPGSGSAILILGM
jgi:hypothetical protein